MAQVKRECPNCFAPSFHFFCEISDRTHPVLTRYRMARDSWNAYWEEPEEKRNDHLWRGFCEYCKSVSDVRVGQGNREKHAQALDLRQKYEFQSAISVYGDILNEDATDHAAYWLRTLSTHEVADENGLFFFASPHEHEPIGEDEDFKKACQLARLSSPADAARYEAEMNRLDAIRAKYMELNKGEGYHICVCAPAESTSIGKSVLARLEEQKRTDLRFFFGNPAQTGNDAEVCHAVNTARVMLLIGNDPAFLDGVARARFWKPFSKRSGVNKLLALTGTGVSEDLNEVARVIDPMASDWMDQVIGEIEKVFPKTETIIQQTTIVEQTVVAESHTAETIEHAYKSFLDHKFKEAYSAAEKVLREQPNHVPAKFIEAFYLSFVQNTTHRDAVDIFFREYVNARLNAEDAKMMKNLFLVSVNQLTPYEEAVIRMILNSEAEDIGPFADAFCSKLIAKQSTRTFLTPSLRKLYCELAQRFTAQKLCLALLSATKTNPDSPIPQNRFYLKTKAQLFRDEYFVPIGEVLASMKDEATRKKFCTVYRNELAKYDAAMRS